MTGCLAQKRVTWRAFALALLVVSASAVLTQAQEQSSAPADAEELQPEAINGLLDKVVGRESSRVDSNLKTHRRRAIS